jgi:tetratricopeptide (TPR) repeat protein
LQELYWSEADPDGRGFVPLADALRQAGDLREAHRLLRDGLNRHPDYLSGHVVAAWLSMDRGDMEEAESRFRIVLAMDSANVAALRGLAEVLLKRGEQEAALECLETLLLEDPVDQTLPDRITDLRICIEADEGNVVEVDELELPVWDNLDAVAEELDWEDASLQSDAGSFGEPEEGKREEEEPEDSPAGRGPAPVVEDGEPIPGPDEMHDALVTSTLGEIFLRQGLFHRAEEVFEALLADDPDNQRLLERLKETRSLMNAPGSPPPGIAEPLTEMDDLPDSTEDRGDMTPSASWEPESRDEVVPIESLAPDRVGPHGRVDLTWEEEVSPQEPVSIEALAPEEPLSIEALAPDEPVAVEALVPEEPIAMEALAPDEPIALEALAPDDPLAVEALAPEEPMAVEALAPDEPMAVEALAPDEPMAVEALAPDEPMAVEALAPDEPMAVEALAPEQPIAMEALAPDEPLAGDQLAPQEPLSIEALAPDEPMAVEALAPDEPMAVDQLAPQEPLSIEALAPDEQPEPGDRESDGSVESEEDSTLEAFERWLENL